MKHVPVTHQAADLGLGSRAFNACWLSAGVGLSIFQMLLLAQTWRESQQALVPALLASAWALGSLAGTRLSASGRLWGPVCLACGLLWLGSPALVGWRLPPALGLQPAPVGMLALALLALVLGACGTAWLAQPRAWPAAGEKTALVRSLVALVVGLLVAWLLPALGGCIALACCLPLLALDVFLSGRAPLPPPGGVAARWMERSWSTERWSVHLEPHGLLPAWRGLVQSGGNAPTHRTLPLLLQASAVAVVLGSVWGAVPTPFAASLQAAHRLDVLGWLLGGQLVALAIGTGSLLAARGVVGFPARVLPRDWQRRGRLVARVLPLAMAASLVALGDPSLQARWWLALSLAAYTLADAAWGILLPRLVPDVTTAVRSQCLLLRGSDARMLDPLHLAYARAGEASAKRWLAWAEGLAIVACTPLLGWLIDRLGGDAVLVLVGMAFAFGLLAAEMVWMLVALVHRRTSPGTRSQRFSGSSLSKLGAAATH